MAKITDKMKDDESFQPRLVKDDPYAELFEGLTADEAVQLQKEIDEAEEAE